MLSLRRRAVLRAAVAGCTLGVAGCSSSCPDRDAPEPDEVVRATDQPAGAFDSTPATDWPAPRFDAGNTGAPPETTPPRGPVGVRWRTQLETVDPAGVAGDASTPVVAGGRVFVTVPGGLHALRFRDGTRAWRTSEVSPNTIGSTFGYDEETVPPVVGPDGTVYVGGKSAITALNPADGSVRWRYDEAQSFGTPAVTETAVYVGGGAGVLALDARDGTERWEADTTAGRTANMVAVGGQSVVLSNGNETTAFDRRTGDRRWSVSPPPEFYPVVSDDTAFVGTYEGLFAFDVEDGTRRWRFERGSGRSFSSPVVTDDTIYAVERPGEGPAATFALDRTDGDPSPRWCSYVGDGAVTAAAGGQAFALLPTGGFGPTPTPSFVAFTDRFGEAVWGYSVRDRLHPPAVVDGAVVFTDGRGHVTALGEVDG